MRNARAVDVGIHQADLRAGVLEAIGERRGDRALADAPFAGADRDHALGREADLPDRLGRAMVLDDANVHVGPRRQLCPSAAAAPPRGFLPTAARPKS